MSEREQYEDWQLANIVAGLSHTMRRALRGEPCPMFRTVKALQARGLIRPGCTTHLTPRGEAVRAYLEARS